MVYNYSKNKVDKMMHEFKTCLNIAQAIGFTFNKEIKEKIWEQGFSQQWLRKVQSSAGI
jgi:hypothetical protein